MARFTRTNDTLFKRRRAQLVDELREKGIKSELVLKAIGSVPRQEFIDTALHRRAYEDCALPIALKQTISQPYTVARQTELLELKPGMKVLEVGTGSGYQAAVLLEMGVKVYSIERHRELYMYTSDLLKNLGYRAELKCGDGTEGWTAYAPYHGIVVTAGAPVVPEALKSQLDEGAKLVIPVGDSGKQTMYRITRQGGFSWEEEHFDEFKFVPLIGKSGWNN